MKVRLQRMVSSKVKVDLKSQTNMSTLELLRMENSKVKVNLSSLMKVLTREILITTSLKELGSLLV